MYVCMYVRTYVCMYLHTYVQYAHRNVHVVLCVAVDAYARLCTHVRTHARTHAHTHTYGPNFSAWTCTPPTAGFRAGAG